jgi:probable rRNA maturation factor
VVVETLRRLDVSDSEVHVLVTGDDRMRRLNQQYRDRDHATDVLSFPDGEELPTGRVLLGQIVLSLDAARRQASELGHSELRELEELVLHGTLHLLGYDHVKDRGDMSRVELMLLEELLS